MTEPCVSTLDDVFTDAVTAKNLLLDISHKYSCCFAITHLFTKVHMVHVNYPVHIYFRIPETRTRHFKIVLLNGRTYAQITAATTKNKQ